MNKHTRLTGIVLVLMAWALAAAEPLDLMEPGSQNLGTLPAHWTLHEQGPQRFFVQTQYQHTNSIGTASECVDITARYSRHPEAGFVVWDSANLVHTSDPGDWPTETTWLRFMEGLAYDSSEALSEEDQFMGFPPSSMEAKFLVSDVSRIEDLAWAFCDQLELNEPRTLTGVDGVILTHSGVSLDLINLTLTWTGVSKINEELCAIIQYESLGLPFDVSMDDIEIIGQAYTQGTLTISLEDKQIEQATLSEDINFEIWVPGLFDPIFQTIARQLTLEKATEPDSLSWTPEDLTPPVNVPICVDHRVELMSILFYLAGNREYGQPLLKNYARDVEAYFGVYRFHPAVQYATHLRTLRDITGRAPLSLATCLTHTYQWDTGMAFDVLDSRWHADEVLTFLDHVRDFIEETHFQNFLAQQQPFYDHINAAGETLVQGFDIDWLDRFFWARSDVSFEVTLGLLTGPHSYGTSLITDQTEQVYAFLGVWDPDLQGTERQNSWGKIARELAHAYVDPLVNTHASQLESSGQHLLDTLDNKPGNPGYEDWETMMSESVAMAIQALFEEDQGCWQEAAAVITDGQASGFIWLQHLVDLISDYKHSQDLYPTFDLFWPQCIDYFRDHYEIQKTPAQPR